MDHVEPNTWRCERPIGLQRGGSGTGRRPSICRGCGALFEMHPVDFCCDCQHLVGYHGEDAGCYRIGPEGWCECLLTFGRDEADYKD